MKRTKEGKRELNRVKKKEKKKKLFLICVSK